MGVRAWVFLRREDFFGWRCVKEFPLEGGDDRIDPGGVLVERGSAGASRGLRR